MKWIAIGVVAVAAIVIVGFLKGIDGALAMTGLSVIGGALGWGVKKAKDANESQTVQLPVVETTDNDPVGSVVLTKVSTKTPTVKDTDKIDFLQVENEVREEIKNKHYQLSYSTLYSVAHNRMVGMKVKNIDQALDGNWWLMGLAVNAFNEAYGFQPSADMLQMDAQVEDYKHNVCRNLTDHEYVVSLWIKALNQHIDSLTRLKAVGLDWQKVPNTHRTVWMLGEYANSVRRFIPKTV